MATKDPRGTPTIPITHPGFLLSCGLGAIGFVLILAGFVIGANVISEIGVLFGSLSLIAALAWRSDLITSWKKKQTGR